MGTTEGQIEIIKDEAHTIDQWTNSLDEITITADLETVDNAHFCNKIVKDKPFSVHRF